MSGPRVVLIVQARIGSTRLPGKSMLDLAGAPLVGRVLERARRSRQIDQIVLATPDTPENDPLAALAPRYGVAGFRGAENDLVDRYYQAARAYRADIVGRLPADNPVPEPAEIDRIVDFHLTHAFAFTSNLAPMLGNGYPDGIGAEMILFGALETAWRTCRDPRKREHVHLNFFDYTEQKAVDPDRFPVGTVECPAHIRRPDIILDVNTPEQYDRMRRLYEDLYPINPEFSIRDVIAWHDRNIPSRIHTAL